MKQEVQFEDLGQMPYQQAWDYQEVLMQQNLKVKSELRLVADSQKLVLDSNKNEIFFESPINDYRLTTNHYLLFVEHPPVYTLGKAAM